MKRNWNGSLTCLAGCLWRFVSEDELYDRANGSVMLLFILPDNYSFGNDVTRGC